MANGKSVDSKLLLLTQDLEQHKRNVEEKFSTLTHNISDLRATLEGWMRSRSFRPWQWAPAIGLCVGGFWFILQLQFSAANSKISSDVATLSATTKENSEQISRLVEIASTHTQQNAESRQDRQDQRARLDRMLDAQGRMQEQFAAEKAERAANEREIETQFDADDQLRNVQWATLMRRLNDMQNALHDMGAKMPMSSDGPYFMPNMSNRVKIPSSTTQ